MVYSTFFFDDIIDVGYLINLKAGKFSARVDKCFIQEDTSIVSMFLMLMCMVLVLIKQNISIFHTFCS